MADRKEFDIADYIKSLKLSDDEKKVAEAIFAKPENLAEAKRGWNSVSEGSRLADEARQASATAATEKAAADAAKVEAERIKAEALAETEKNRVWFGKLKEYEDGVTRTEAERDAFAVEKAAYEAYLESIGVEPSFALSGKQPIKPGTPPPPPGNGNGNETVFDETKFAELLGKQGYVKQSDLQPAAQLMVNLPFELQEVQLRHAELFGKMAPIDKIKALQTAYLARENTRPLMDIAAESFHFADRQKELDEQALNERAEQIATEKFEKRMSELHLPAAVIERIRDDVPVKFASDDFSKNTSRAGEVSAANVSDKDMEAFLQLDAELAQQGIRPNL